MAADLLNKPYPISLNKWRTTYLISSFIFLFLLVFQPFGISSIQEFKALKLLGYGFATFISLLFCLFALPQIFKNWFKENTWVVKKQILWLFIILTCISISNFIYSSIVFSFNNNFQTFLALYIITILVGIIPISAVTILSYNKHLKQNLAHATEANQNISYNSPIQDINDNITLKGENKNEVCDIKTSNLLCIESAGNYINIYTDNPFNKTTLRSTLKNITKQLHNIEQGFNCHRAYWINMNKIDHVTGNAQGLKVHFKNIDMIVPVSRALTQDFKSKLQHYK